MTINDIIEDMKIQAAGYKDGTRGTITLEPEEVEVIAQAVADLDTVKAEREQWQPRWDHSAEYDLLVDLLVGHPVAAPPGSAVEQVQKLQAENAKMRKGVAAGELTELRKALEDLLASGWHSPDCAYQDDHECDCGMDAKLARARAALTPKPAT